MAYFLRCLNVGGHIECSGLPIFERVLYFGGRWPAWLMEPTGMCTSKLLHIQQVVWHGHTHNFHSPVRHAPIDCGPAALCHTASPTQQRKFFLMGAALLLILAALLPIGAALTADTDSPPQLIAKKKLKVNLPFRVTQAPSHGLIARTDRSGSMQ